MDIKSHPLTPTQSRLENNPPLRRLAGLPPHQQQQPQQQQPALDTPPPNPHLARPRTRVRHLRPSRPPPRAARIPLCANRPALRRQASGAERRGELASCYFPLLPYPLPLPLPCTLRTLRAPQQQTRPPLPPPAGPFHQSSAPPPPPGLPAPWLSRRTQRYRTGGRRIIHAAGLGDRRGDAGARRASGKQSGGGGV